jgi:glycosyltransferase involved in cell wall biosynthesis
VWKDQPRFGALAMQLAGVTQAQLDAALEQQRQSGGRLGEILSRQGLLGRHQVQQILAEQARWTAHSLEEAFGKTLFPRPTFLSLCMPAYNEQDVIEDTIDAAVAVLSAFVERFEVIVVDDGSRDRTGDIIAQYGERDSRVRLVRHPENRGYGSAVTTGLRAARGDLVVFSDSDGQFSFLDLAQLLARLPETDIVIGYRWRRADHWIRRFNAWGWGRLVRLVLGVKVRDLDCAFKLFPRQVIEQVQITSGGAAINAEIMAQCVHGGLKIRETPVRHYPRYSGAPTGAARKVILRAFRELPPLVRYRFSAVRFVLPPALAVEPVAVAARNGHPVPSSNGHHANGSNGHYVTAVNGHSVPAPRSGERSAESPATGSGRLSPVGLTE